MDGSTGESDESFTDEQLIEKNRDRTKVALTLDTMYPLSCPCETHLTKIYAERVFSYEVDELFDLIFGENSFTRAFHDSQKLTGRILCYWRRIDFYFDRLCCWRMASK